ncbi:hypothetical protein OG413_07165 [Streptomyces sp. NBC_01433]|uniref:hypothetical protein n=1 Tax=Streptomyces sp. NBC_01433 TaxID=2903864 RepID=UPI002254263C|nr:hypothetical protein [Streptomyces sp. NBC_01433]MCX4675103.1 hypothetical protein [Streptomyces sp. NBC_01433]
MSLASVAPEGPRSPSAPPGEGGAGGLRHSGGPWTTASGAAETLRISTERSHRRLGSAHEGVASGARGLASAAALKSVQESWEERLTGVRDECGYLRTVLLRVAKDVGETDAAVDRSFGAVAKGGSR